MAPLCSVLLDLDGTLIDSQPGILASCLAALRTLGHEPNEILDIKRVIGPPLEDAMHPDLPQHAAASRVEMRPSAAR
jgi:phosphoglycolate phosphatase